MTKPLAPTTIGERQAIAERGIYVASRASIPERGQMWRELRAAGVKINSSWIDEDGEGQTEDWSELWRRIEREVKASAGLILYAEPSDFPLKGAFVEAGIAIASGVPVVIVAPGVDLGSYGCRPIGSWASHPLVSYADGIQQAVDTILATTTTNAPVADREAIARIIDPETWQANDDIEAGNHHGYSISKVGVDCAVSLAKAAHILALRQTLPIHGEMREALSQGQRDAICRAAEFLDACAGEDLEVEGITAISIVEDLQQEFLCEDQDDCFHIEVRRLLPLRNPSNTGSSS
jgi:hypothetical protein